MKMIKKILLVITLVFSTISTQSNAVDSIPVMETCGLENGKINPFDNSICKEDISFITLYEFFPDIWEESVFSIFNFDYLKTLKDDAELNSNNQYLKFSNLFKAIMQVILNISMLSIFSLIIFQSFVVLFNSVENGEFLGRNWKTSTMVKKGAIITILLTPVGNSILVSNAIVLALSSLAISLANFFYGFYLSFIEVSSTEKSTYVEDVINTQNNKDLEKNKGLDMSGHNLFYSNNYVTSLAKMELCRQTTSQYQLENIENILDSSNLKTYEKCSSSQIDKPYFNLINIKNNLNYDSNSFINYNVTELLNDNFVPSAIFFKKNKIENCNENELPEFNCGSITVSTPDIQNNPLISEILGKTFLEKTKSTIKSLSQYPDSNHNLIRTGWLDIKSDIENKLKAIISKGSVVGNIKEYNIASTVFNKDGTIKDGSMIKHLSYTYHTLVMNSILIGFTDVINKKEISAPTSGSGIASAGSISFSTSYSIGTHDNTNLFLENYKKAKEIADLTQEYQCLKNNRDLDGSLNFLRRIQTGVESNKNSLRCINFETNTVYGTNNGELYKEKVPKDELELRKEKIIKKHQDLTKTIYKQRLAVESSFFESIGEYSNNSLLQELRQKGWLTFATYLIQVNKEINATELVKKDFVNSIHIAKNDFNNKFISNTIFNPELKSSSLYADYIGSVDVLNDINVNINNANSHYMDTSMFSHNVLQNNMDKMDTGSMDLMDSILLIVNPVSALKKSMGLIDTSVLVDENIDIEELCNKDVSLCPIPKQNPFIQLNNLGHYFIQGALSYFTAITLVSIYPRLLKAKAKKEIGYLSGTKDANSLSGKIADSNYKEKMNKLDLKLKGLDMISGLLNLFSQIVVLILIMGVVLAYIIPLLPFIYFLVGFLIWFVQIMQTFFVIPIWSAYLVNYEDNKDKLKSFLFNNFMEILLKPSFLVSSLVFIWSLYSVFIFFINMTITPLLKAMSSDSGLILSMLSNVMISFVFVFILFALTAEILKMIDDVYVKMFGHINVRASSDELDQVSTIMQYFAFKTLLEKAKSGASILSNSGPSYRDMKQTAMNQAQERQKLFENIKKYNPKKSDYEIYVDIEEIANKNKENKIKYGVLK